MTKKKLKTLQTPPVGAQPTYETPRNEVRPWLPVERRPYAGQIDTAEDTELARNYAADHGLGDDQI